jgi:hypothetical protein
MNPHTTSTQAETDAECPYQFLCTGHAATSQRHAARFRVNGCGSGCQARSPPGDLARPRQGRGSVQGPETSDQPSIKVVQVIGHVQ